MANERPKWKRINMGDILPCQSFLRKKDGEILKLSTIGGVKVGQDCYYLPVDEVINVIKNYPIEESEDERIINNIKKVIGWYRGMFTEKSLMPEEYQEIDAWLEKQGEQKPDEWTMDNIEELTEFENAMMHIGGSFFGEHQGLDPNDTFVVKEQAKILLEMAPKQEWSAKDENFLNTTIAYLRDAYSKDKIDFKDTAKNCVNWLKTLKDRVLPQPKQEWSEEDYNEIEIIACHLDNIGNEAMAESLLNIRDKYKSCRPQNTWKPSEEQIEALEHFIVYHNGSSNYAKDLEELRLQLKKLREE